MIYYTVLAEKDVGHLQNMGVVSYVFNANEGKTYFYNWNGELISEYDFHPDEFPSFFMEDLDGSVTC